MLVGAGEGAELDDEGEVAGAVDDFGIVVLDVRGKVDVDFGVGPGDEVEALAVGEDVGGGAGGGVLVEVVEAEELDHLRGGCDDGDGIGGLPGERGADAVLPGGEEVGGSGLGEGGGGVECDEAEGEDKGRATVFLVHGLFLANELGYSRPRLARWGADDFLF